MAYVVTINGSIHDIGNSPTLEAMQKEVGGFIERVDLGEVVLYVNEEGLIKGLPVNRAIEKATDGIIFFGNVIVMEKSSVANKRIA